MEYTIIGNIIKTHGIKGELIIRPVGQDIDRFSDIETVYIGDSKELLHPIRTRLHKGNIIMEFKEYNNINQVLNLTNQKIYISEEDIIELKEDEYFADDLIDMDIYDLEENYIGVVKSILHSVNNDLCEIEDINGKKHLIPMIKEFIKKIDIKGSKIYIKTIEGLIE